MRKIVAILLIVVLFINWYGYRIVTGILADNADQRLEKRLDLNQYDESQLVEVRIPIKNMPYQKEQAEFERHYGEMKVDGKFYTYVKRKIQDGFLVLKCIPNDSKESIKAAGNDFFKLANGLDQDHPDKKQSNNSNLAKTFSCEYDGREADFNVDIFSDLINKSFLNSAFSLSDLCLSLPGQPPEPAVSSVG